MKLKIVILVGCIVFIVIFGIYQSIQSYDNKLHVIFCDVGQADAIFIRTPGDSKILVDGGPDSSVLNCLARHLPFWDRTIDLVILSHPHQDHFVGLMDVFKNYTIKTFATEELKNKSASYQEFENIVNSNPARKQIVYAGDSFHIPDGTQISILAPTSDFIHVTSPDFFIGSSEQFASVIPYLTFGSFKLLLTGDTQSPELLGAIDSFGLDSVDVLQVPHHGSKTGLSQAIVNALHPSFAVISVGANNQYGLPAPKTVQILQQSNVPFEMTKDAGDVEIVSDGKSMSLGK